MGKNKLKKHKFKNIELMFYYKSEYDICQINCKKNYKDLLIN